MPVYCAPPHCAWGRPAPPTRRALLRLRSTSLAAAVVRAVTPPAPSSCSLHCSLPVYTPRRAHALSSLLCAVGRWRSASRVTSIWSSPGAGPRSSPSMTINLRRECLGPYAWRFQCGATDWRASSGLPPPRRWPPGPVAWSSPRSGSGARLSANSVVNDRRVAPAPCLGVPVLAVLARYGPRGAASPSCARCSAIALFARATDPVSGAASVSMTSFVPP